MVFFKRNFNYIQKFIFTITFLFLFVTEIKCDEDSGNTYNKTISDSCSSNLECNSACCSSGKCSETSKCEKLVKIVYIVEAALCLVFIIAFTIYLVIKLKKIKEDFKNKTSPEDAQNNPKQN